MQAKVDTLIGSLETAVVGALGKSIGRQQMDVENGSLELVVEPVKDIESGFELAEEIGKALVLGLVEDARRLLSKKAAKLIGEAAKDVAFTAELRLFKNTRPAVGKKETDGLLSKEGRIEEGVQLTAVVQDVKAQLLQVGSGGTECGMLITARARNSENRYFNILQSFKEASDPTNRARCCRSSARPWTAASTRRSAGGSGSSEARCSTSTTMA
jgi:hypothetical protein